MQHKSKEGEWLYFPDRLVRQLTGVLHYPLSIVEAPSGFGKTTALREYLGHLRPDDADIFRYTCLGESRGRIWREIADLVGRVDAQAAKKLRDMGIPDRDSLSDVVAAMRECRCERDTILLIDNYQLAEGLPDALPDAFSCHGNHRLHMILVTQQYLPESSTNNPYIYHIRPTWFFYRKEDIAACFRLAGIRLKPEDIEAAWRGTEGWIAAIRLQIMNYREQRTIENAGGMERLIEATIWNRLTQEEREFLMSVCVLDGFSAKQAQIVSDNTDISEEIGHLLENNVFIRWHSAQGVWSIHGIFLDYLRDRFYNRLPPDVKNRALRFAAASLVAEKEYYPAAKLYRLIPDYDAMLNLPFDNTYVDEQKEDGVIDFLSESIFSCPRETLARHPMMLIRYAFQMFGEGRMEEFGFLTGIVEELAEGGGGLLPERERNRLRGELAMLYSFMTYNDIQKMSEGHREAWEFLGERSVLLSPQDSWTFGGVSVLNMYWGSSGELADTLDTFDSCLPLYCKLGGGHGSGANTVMRAEAFFMEGREDDAEALCRRALYEAEMEKQQSITFCADLVLARLALYRGQWEAYTKALEDMRLRMEDKGLYTVPMLDMCTAFLDMTMGIADNVALWIQSPERIVRKLDIVTVPFAHILHLKWLALRRQYNEFRGMADMFLEQARQMNYLLPQVYIHILTAGIQHAAGRRREAGESLSQALELALPDRIWMPFAEHIRILAPLLNDSTVQNRDGLSEILKLGERQMAGVEAIRKRILSGKPLLTPREREVARLAAEGLTGKEIAATLFISRETVKSTLKSIYGKLGVHNRTELSRMDL